MFLLNDHDAFNLSKQAPPALQVSVLILVIMPQGVVNIKYTCIYTFIGIHNHSKR